MNLETIRSVIGRGGDHLGDILFWTLADANIDRAQLGTIWSSAGLPCELLPDPPTPAKALKLAVREAQLGQRDRLIRLGVENEKEIVFAVVRENHLQGGDLDYAQEARVVLDRATASLSSDQRGHDLVAIIDSNFLVFRHTHTADDVRRAVVKALQSFAAVALRPNGGVYWLPVTYSRQVRQLQKAIEQIGNSRLYLLPVHRSAEAERTLGEVATSSIEAELAALQSEIASFVTTPPERCSTLERRLEAFQELRGRGRLYSTILRTQVEGLDRELDQLAAQVEGLLAEKNASRAA